MVMRLDDSAGPRSSPRPKSSTTAPRPTPKQSFTPSNPTPAPAPAPAPRQKYATSAQDSWRRVFDFFRPRPERRPSDAVMNELQSRHGFDPGLLNSRAAWMNAGVQVGDPESTLVGKDSPLGQRPEHTLSPYQRIPGADNQGQPPQPMPRPREFSWKDPMRTSRAGEAYEMTVEDWEKLSSRQKAALEFNAALLDAATRDQLTKTTKSTQALLDKLGIKPIDTDELDSFLKLQRAVDDELLARMGNRDEVHKMADSLRWARGDRASALEANRLNDALNFSTRAEQAIAKSLAAGGSGSLVPDSAEAPPGYGTTIKDQVIQDAYLRMIDANSTLTPEQVVAGLAQLNEQTGVDATPQELWDFISRQLQVAEASPDPRQRTKPPLPSTVNQAEFSTLDISEIRKRYGL